MIAWPLPSPEDQVIFLQHVQRLFDEGEFTATYKYALLLALAELAVERGDDTGAPLDLPMTAIGEKFAELYWRQAAPYQSGVPGTAVGILSQNLGTQAAVVRQLMPVFEACGGRLPLARQHPLWPGTVAEIAGVVRQMPVQYLQMLGGQLVPFLYDYPPPRGRIILKAGVGFLLRRYQGLVQQLARGGWIRHVRSNQRNRPLLGPLDDLEAFMFGAARSDLGIVAEVLAPIQSGRCFYCQEHIQGRGEVDHFIPWSRYPRDTAHNFVLAHARCNHDKRDLLAAPRHLERWLRRLQDHADAISEPLAASGFVVDPECSRLVARWAYRQATAAEAVGWVTGGSVERLTPGVMELFGIEGRSCGQ